MTVSVKVSKGTAITKKKNAAILRMTIPITSRKVNVLNPSKSRNKSTHFFRTEIAVISKTANTNSGTEYKKLMPNTETVGTPATDPLN